MTKRSIVHIHRALSLLLILSLLLSPVSLTTALSPRQMERPAPGSPSPAPLAEAPTAALTTTLTSTPTLTPAATTTLTPTLTLTPTPTVTASPPVTPAPAPAAALSLSKTAVPEAVAPGEVVTFTIVLSNTGAAPTRDLLLRDTLPEGLAYLPGSAPDAEYDPLTASLTWNLPGLEAGQAISRSLAARATSLPGETLTNTATLSGGDLARPLMATAPVYLREPGLIRPETGGTLQSADGRVELHFPPGAVERLTAVSHRPLPPVDLSPDFHLFYRFELNAWQAGRPDLPVTAFNRPLTLTLTYDDADVDGLLEESLRLLHWDRKAGAWRPLPTTVDPKANRLAARVAHFGVFGGGGEEGAFFLPRIEAGQVSLFSGDASFSYQLEVPAGAGGMQVPLLLRYNSGIPNSMRRPLVGEDRADTGWVGVGWSLNVGEFSNDDMLTLNGLASGTVRDGDGEAVPGQACDWDNKCDTGDWISRTHVLNDVQFFRIQSNRFYSDEDHPPGDRIEGLGQFDLWTRDGTHYVFGSQPYAPSGPGQGSGSRLYLTAVNGRRVYETYKLDRIVDPHGNTVEIEYTVFPKDGTSHLKEAYPARIKYTTNPEQGDTHAEYEVEFVIVDKDYDTQADKRLAETGKLLTAVKVWYQAQPGAPVELVREYAFSYDDYDDPHFYLLNGITHYGDDGQQSLPATTFSYAAGQIGWRVNGENGGNWYTANRRFLQTVDNGYGGALAFAYADWVCYDYASAADVDYESSTCAAYAADRLAWSQRQVVDSKTVSAGSSPPLATGYRYEKADVRWTRDPPAGSYGCRGKETGDQYETCFEAFYGFEGVTEEWQDGGQVVREAETRFHDTHGLDEVDPIKGKPEETWLRDGAGELYAHSETEYGTYHESEWEAEANWVYVSQVTEESCAGGTCRSQRTAYEYGEVSQGGQQYGNLTQIQEYDANDQLYRSTRRWYFPNRAAHIVDRVGSEGVWLGSWEEWGPVTWYYDGQNSHMATPLTGDLTRVQRHFDPAWESGTAGIPPVTWQTSEVTYAYDDYGNRTDETTFRDRGTVHQQADWTPDEINFPVEGRVTTIEYDDVHHTFPLTVTNPLGYTTVTRYYGVDGMPAGDGLPGQVASVSDANDLETRYRYDAFGRPLKEIRPGDSEGLPTIEYQYRDAYPARRISAYREVSGHGGNLPVVELYDGLGRPLQTRTESQEASQQAVVNYTYDSLGRRAREYLPRFETFSWEYSQPSGPYTAYSYDALDRSTEVTHADGTQTRRRYGVWYDGILGKTVTYEDVVDGNGHRKQYRTDAFGRLVRVQEMEGNCEGSTWYPCDPGDTPWTVYANTFYAYDLVDNLEVVTDTAGNTTTMSYDMLGRKTAMDDPDMGAWSYEYDAAGNLTRQDDALGQRLCFYYDHLDRLEGKHYTSDTSPCPAGPDHPVRFYYDGQTCPGCGTPTGKVVGQRTAAWTADSWAVYGYDDVRGRLSRESKSIGGGDPYVTEWSYDALDRVVTMTYPDPTPRTAPGGEVITTTYTAQGLPATLTGDTAYVSAATYNALGQLKLLDLGAASGEQTTYTYYGEGATPPSGYSDVPSFRLMEIETVDGGGTAIQRLRYGYDDAGNVAALWDDFGFNGQAESWTFAYDALDRLTGADGAYSAHYEYSPIGNLELKAEDGITYTLDYADPDHVHAVSRVNGADQQYDDNGNMTLRVVDGVTYTQAWDAENRLIQVISGTQTTQFVYDADGALVKKVVDGEAVIYVGNYYEENLTTGEVTTYYYFNGQRVAMKRDGVLQYLVGDHLGTTSLILNADGTLHSEARHYPYGQERWITGTLPTDYRFTAQKAHSSTGNLYHMGARFYDGALGRWISPDTLVPDPANPQSFSRYAYVYNNPCRYVDPSGHSCADALEGYPAEEYDCQALEGSFLIFYLNGLGGPDGEGYQYIVSVLSMIDGGESVVHIPLFTEIFVKGLSHLDMVGEALGISADQTQYAAEYIRQHLSEHPLDPEQQLVLVGSSAGGTVAIEVLDLLDESGIYVDQLVLRGAFVHELSIGNVGRVDYIAADPPESDRYYSLDINPFDSVDVNEHRVYGLVGHAASTERQRRQVAGLIVDLIVGAQPR